VDPALNADPSLASNGSKQYCLFDDDEGEAWEQESDDWWLTDVERQQVHECSTVPTIEATLFEGESVQAALNARLRRTARLTFFDDESGEDEPQIEPDDYEQLAGIVDKRGMPEFSKAAKFAGPWLGMVFKRGSCGLGYYRDGFKVNLSVTTLLPAVADVSPVTLKLSELINDNSKDEKVGGLMNLTPAQEGRRRRQVGKAKVKVSAMCGPRTTHSLQAPPFTGP